MGLQAVHTRQRAPEHVLHACNRSNPHPTPTDLQLLLAVRCSADLLPQPPALLVQLHGLCAHLADLVHQPLVLCAGRETIGPADNLFETLDLEDIMPTCLK